MHRGLQFITITEEIVVTRIKALFAKVSDYLAHISLRLEALNLAGVALPRIL